MLHRLAREPDFTALVTSFEERLQEIGEDASEATIARCIPDARLHPFCRLVTSLTPLFELFRRPPSLAAYRPIEVETLAAVADLRPHPELMLESGDAPFMRVLRQLAQPGGTPDRIFFEDLTKLVALRSAYPAVFKALPPLALTDESWAGGARTLEAALQSGKDEGLPEPWGDLFGAIRKLDAEAEADGSSTALLLQTPRLSEMLPQEVVAFGEVQGELPQPDKLLSDTVYTGSVTASEAEKSRLLAQYALTHMNQARHDDIRTRLELRHWAAEYCLALRRFAKLNALEQQWPELARMLRYDRATLKALEAAARNPQNVAPEHRSVWEGYAGDRHLRDFLVLKPLATDIAPAEVRQYFSVSESITPAGDLGVPRPGAGPSAADGVRPRFDYVDLVLTLTPRVPDAPGEPEDAGDAHPLPAQVRLSLREAEGQPLDETVDVPWADLMAFLPQLARPAAQALISRGIASRESPERHILRQGVGPEAMLRELGGLMWRWVFAGTVGERVRGLHASGAACRLLLNMPAELAVLPWETLHLERERIFLALTQRFSLVRYMGSSLFVPELGITAPLRILVVLCSPPDTAPLNLEGELAAMQEAVEPGVSDGRVSLSVLRHRKANIDELSKTLRTFRPHIFHFSGHGVFHRGDNEGALVFHDDETGKARMIPAADLVKYLSDARISLAFLNACDTGTAAENDAITGVAGSLVNAGVPAVIATLREITDDAGLLFTREFYRAFAEGYPLEAALAEARKRLSVERWDWSAYALFSSTRRLDALMFPQGGPARNT
jgi:hypothetical protein